MKRHIAYLRYVLAHKWFVFVAGRKVGVPLWRLVIHDWTKFTPTEWGPYARNFFEADGSRRRGTPANGFRLAWLSHQRNRHHWQAWISIGDGGELTPLRMPEVYVREMVADWMGAGRAITGRWEVQEWYTANRDKMVLHRLTRLRVEELLS